MAGFSVVQAKAAGTTNGSSNGGGNGSGSGTDDGKALSALYSPAVVRLLQAPDLAPVKTFVGAALAAKLKGNAVNYRHIVDTIR
jgi:hypothetical protein